MGNRPDHRLRVWDSKIAISSKNVSISARGNVTLTLNREGKPRMEWLGMESYFGLGYWSIWPLDLFYGGHSEQTTPKRQPTTQTKLNVFKLCCNTLYTPVQFSVGETRVLQDQIVFYSSNTIFWVAVKNDLHFRSAISSKDRLREEGQNWVQISCDHLDLRMRLVAGF